MPIRSPLSLKVGTIIDKTLAVVEYNVAPALIYVAALTVINAAVKYFTLDRGLMDQAVIGLGSFAVGVGAAYLLLDAMVRRTGLRTRAGGDVFLAYVGLSILYTLGFVAGLILIIIPGLVVIARWSIAAPMLMARGDSPTKALGESWERTRGAEFQILMAVFALLILPIVIIIACSVLFDPADPVGIAITQLFSSAAGVVSQALGVALYGLIVGGEDAASPAA